MVVNNLSMDYWTILSVLGNLAVADQVGLGVSLTTVLASLWPGAQQQHAIQHDSENANLVCKHL
jgi:hypothetical protein